MSASRPSSRRSIAAALAAPQAPIYRMARRNRFLGRWLAHGEGYPDWNLRLFDRKEARWSDDPVHEKVLYAVTPGTLEGDLLHESATDLSDYLAKQNRYTTLAAEQLHATGERPGWRCSCSRRWCASSSSTSSAWASSTAFRGSSTSRSAA